MKNCKNVSRLIVKNSEGITLVALVITIVILLILAGISISTLTNTGIFEKAQDAKKKSLEADEKEKISISVTEAQLGNKGYQELTAENLQSSISSSFKDKTTNVISNGDGSFTVIIKDSEEREYTIESDGTISLGKYDKWDGKSSTEPTEKTSNEIHIYTASELKWLANQVNNEGNTFDGYTIYLENNLDLGAREKDGEWETTENEAVKWTAIGKTSNNMLKGTFEGNNHTIKGVYVNDSTDFNGIFGNTNSVLNITIKNSYIKGGSCTGGIVGTLRSGTVENCHNINTQVILMEGENHFCGGIIGDATGTVNKCSNTGKIQGLGSYSGWGYYGGIVGILRSGVAKNCKNFGEVYGNGKCTGGIIALTNHSTAVSDCHNSGTVSGKNNTGGVVGYAFTSSTLSDCHNTGTVSGEAFTGGVVGGAANIVTKCSNTGNVTGTTDDGTGGIVGTCVTKIPQNISLCYNSGKVAAEGGVGGISGYLGAQGYAGTETKCYNKGEIVYTGTKNTYGEIIGNMANDATVTKCFYLNKNKSIFGVGAINEGGNLEEQRKGAQPTNVDLKSYDEFIKWIENQ